jgi:hypothetical protein
MEQMSETTKAQKEMPTLGVLGVATGILLKQGGFGEIHEVFDHLYPGIMTLGVAHMSGTASREILRQVPGIADLGECNGENYERYAHAGLAKFGPTILVEGPHGTGNPDMFDGQREL